MPNASGIITMAARNTSTAELITLSLISSLTGSPVGERGAEVAGEQAAEPVEVAD